MTVLDILDHLAAIATATVAFLAYLRWTLDRRKKVKVLEEYLRDEYPKKRHDGDSGRRTVIHLIAAVGMTENEILEAAFRSKKIERSVGVDAETNRANCVYFNYRR